LEILKLWETISSELNDTKELSRINVDNAKTIANTARETAEFSVNRQRKVYT
jgi:hypothetical protein